MYVGKSVQDEKEFCHKDKMHKHRADKEKDKVKILVEKKKGKSKKKKKLDEEEQDARKVFGYRKKTKIMKIKELKKERDSSLREVNWSGEKNDTEIDDIELRQSRKIREDWNCCSVSKVIRQRKRSDEIEIDDKNYTDTERRPVRRRRRNDKIENDDKCYRDTEMRRSGKRSDEIEIDDKDYSNTEMRRSGKRSDEIKIDDKDYSNTEMRRSGKMSDKIEIDDKDYRDTEMRRSGKRSDEIEIDDKDYRDTEMRRSGKRRDETKIDDKNYNDIEMKRSRKRSSESDIQLSTIKKVMRSRKRSDDQDSNVRKLIRSRKVSDKNEYNQKISGVVLRSRKGSDEKEIYDKDSGIREEIKSRKQCDDEEHDRKFYHDKEVNISKKWIDEERQYYKTGNKKQGNYKSLEGTVDEESSGENKKTQGRNKTVKSSKHSASDDEQFYRVRKSKLPKRIYSRKNREREIDIAKNSKDKIDKSNEYECMENVERQNKPTADNYEYESSDDIVSLHDKKKYRIHKRKYEEKQSHDEKSPKRVKTSKVRKYDNGYNPKSMSPEVREKHKNIEIETSFAAVTNKSEKRNYEDDFSVWQREVSLKESNKMTFVEKSKDDNGKDIGKMEQGYEIDLICKSQTQTDKKMCVEKKCFKKTEKKFKPLKMTACSTISDTMDSFNRDDIDESQKEKTEKELRTITIHKQNTQKELSDAVHLCETEKEENSRNFCRHKDLHCADKKQKSGKRSHAKSLPSREKENKSRKRSFGNEFVDANAFEFIHQEVCCEYSDISDGSVKNMDEHVSCDSKSVEVWRSSKDIDFKNKKCWNEVKGEGLCNIKKLSYSEVEYESQKMCKSTELKKEKVVKCVGRKCKIWGKIDEKESSDEMDGTKEKGLSPKSSTETIEDEKCILHRSKIKTCAKCNDIGDSNEIDVCAKERNGESSVNNNVREVSDEKGFCKKDRTDNTHVNKLPDDKDFINENKKDKSKITIIIKDFKDKMKSYDTRGSKSKKTVSDIKGLIEKREFSYTVQNEGKTQMMSTINEPTDNKDFNEDRKMKLMGRSIRKLMHEKEFYGMKGKVMSHTSSKVKNLSDEKDFSSTDRTADDSHTRSVFKESYDEKGLLGEVKKKETQKNISKGLSPKKELETMNCMVELQDGRKFVEENKTNDKQTRHDLNDEKDIYGVGTEKNSSKFESVKKESGIEVSLNTHDQERKHKARSAESMEKNISGENCLFDCESGKVVPGTITVDRECSKGLDFSDSESRKSSSSMWTVDRELSERMEFPKSKSGNSELQTKSKDRVSNERPNIIDKERGKLEFTTKYADSKLNESSDFFDIERGKVESQTKSIDYRKLDERLDFINYDRRKNTSVGSSEKRLTDGDGRTGIWRTRSKDKEVSKEGYQEKETRKLSRKRGIGKEFIDETNFPERKKRKTFSGARSVDVDKEFEGERGFLEDVESKRVPKTRSKEKELCDKKKLNMWDSEDKSQKKHGKELEVSNSRRFYKSSDPRTSSDMNRNKDTLYSHDMNKSYDSSFRQNGNNIHDSSKMPNMDRNFEVTNRNSNVSYTQDENRVLDSSYTQDSNTNSNSWYTQDADSNLNSPCTHNANRNFSSSYTQNANRSFESSCHSDKNRNCYPSHFRSMSGKFDRCLKKNLESQNMNRSFDFWNMNSSFDSSPKIVNRSYEMASYDRDSNRSFNSTISMTPEKSRFRIPTYKELTGRENESEGDFSNDKKEDFELFWRIQSPFSQFHPAKFEVRGIQYNCAEQFFMHQKALTFDDREIAAAIMRTNVPKEQKVLGRKIRNFCPKIWFDKAISVVKEGNTAKVSVKAYWASCLLCDYAKVRIFFPKCHPLAVSSLTRILKLEISSLFIMDPWQFSQNVHLKQQLFATYPKLMAEASPVDCTWGIGLAKDNELAWSRKTWRGQNFLGYALTEVRNELMKKEGLISD